MTGAALLIAGCCPHGIIPPEVEPGAAMLRRMGAGTVMTHQTLAGTLLQINFGRDDVEQLSAE